MLPFDEYVSLGWNCEPALHIRRVLSRDGPSPFNWGIFEIDVLISMIETRCAGMLQSNSWEWEKGGPLISDREFGYKFHGLAAWTPRQPFDQAAVEAYQAKCAERIDRFFAPEGRRLYIYKPPHTMPKDRLERLAELLDRITPDAVMVLIRLANHTSSNATHPMIRERMIRFPGPNDAMIEGDTPAWDAVFAEFPQRDVGLRASDPPPRVPSAPAGRSRSVNASTSSLITAISPNDQMKGDSSAEDYFRAGSTALELCIDALKGRTPKKIVDFPSGHGRALRWFRQRWPSASLHAVEIDDDALTFCQNTFGAEPLRSTPGFSSLTLPRDVDLIWSGSLLTHLNVDAWRSFLALAVAALAPGGVLVATTHGRLAAMLAKQGYAAYGTLIDVKELAKTCKSAGFAYDDYDRTYPTYGLSFASPQWVLGQLQTILDVKITYFREGGWGYQDAFALEKLAGPMDL